MSSRSGHPHPRSLDEHARRLDRREALEVLRYEVLPAFLLWWALTLVGVASMGLFLL